MRNRLRRYSYALLAVLFSALPAVALDSFQIIRPLIDQTVKLGSDVTFTATYRAPAAVTFKWEHDGEVVANQTNPTLNLQSVQGTDIGTYTLTITSGTAILTTSAILDIDTPYPDARFSSISPVFGIDFSGQAGNGIDIILGAFPNGCD